MQSGAFVPWASKPIHVAQRLFDWVAYALNCSTTPAPDQPDDPQAAIKLAASTLSCLRKVKPPAIAHFEPSASPAVASIEPSDSLAVAPVKPSAHSSHPGRAHLRLLRRVARPLDCPASCRRTSSSASRAIPVTRASPSLTRGSTRRGRRPGTVWSCLSTPICFSG